MATSRISYNTTLSPSKNDRRQVQARIRALQQRTNALSEELSRSSSIADSTVHNIERTFIAITNEFQEQRDQLMRRIHQAKQNIRQSSNELKHISKNLNSTKSYNSPQNSSRYSNDIEIQEMNAIVDDVERELGNIAQQLKQYRFKPSYGHVANKKLGTIFTTKEIPRKDALLSSRDSFFDQYDASNNVSMRKLFTIDLDISADWIVASIKDRIYICDHEGEIRIFSYSNRFRRQPLLTERFHLSNIRLVSSFTATNDYLVSFEKDTRTITLHTHHGALLVRLNFPYDPIMITRGDYSTKNNIWSCSRTKRECFQLRIDHVTKEVRSVEQFDFKRPVSNILIDPIGISTDEQGRVAVHDVNSTTTDRLLLYDDNQDTIIPLDLIKYADRHATSRIERVLLVSKQPNLVVVLYAPQPTTNNLHEIVILDIELQPVQILHHLTETNSVKNIDLTLHGELVYSVTPPANKRMTPKMHIYSIFK